MSIFTENQKHWAKIITTILAVFALCFVFAVACTDADSLKQPTTEEISHCDDTVGALDLCFGIEDTFGITVEEGKAECRKGIDDHDRCMMDCENDAEDCDEFEDCLNDC